MSTAAFALAWAIGAHIQLKLWKDYKILCIEAQFLKFLKDVLSVRLL